MCVYLCMPLPRYINGESLRTIHIAVFVAETLSFAKTNSIDDTGMVQGVRDHGILVGEDGLKDTCVGIKAGSIKDSVFGAVELCDLVFEVFVDVLLKQDRKIKKGIQEQ